MLRRAAPAAVAGTVSVILGGLVAAATGPAGWDHGSWVAAYLVLVNGVAQTALGSGRVLLDERAPMAREDVAELVCWNLGSVLVITGVLVGSVPVVVAGSALLVVALGLLLRAVRGSGAWLWAYRALVLVLLVSVPIGVALSAQRT